jgi:hypothetical protein
MKKPRRLSDAVKTRLRELGNPYASLQMFDEVEDVIVEANDAPLGLTLKQSENPWATLYFKVDPTEKSAAMADVAKPKVAAKLKVSKSEFQQACRAIFRCYIPEVEKGRIRDHHRDFILRNESRPPATRHRALEELRRYDLSTIAGFQTHFNRERDVFTEAKLKEIERHVGGDEQDS